MAVKFADMMLKEGIYVVGFCYPVVPKGKARIRTQLSAAHTFEEVDKAVEAFIKVGKELKVIEWKNWWHSSEIINKKNIIYIQK